MATPPIYCDTNVLAALATGRGLEERPNESGAISELMVRVFAGDFVLIDSFALRAELRLYRDHTKRALRRGLVDGKASLVVRRTKAIESRARELKTALGLSQRDAQHVACAEAAGARVLLTYDKRMLAADGLAKVPIRAPFQFLDECDA